METKELDVTKELDDIFKEGHKRRIKLINTFYIGYIMTIITTHVWNYFNQKNILFLPSFIMLVIISYLVRYYFLNKEYKKYEQYKLEKLRIKEIENKQRRKTEILNKN